MFHVEYGMPDVEAVEQRPPWVRFAGCIMDGPVVTRWCDACEHAWNPPEHDVVVRDVGDLLHETDSETFEELADSVHENYELDTFLTLTDEGIEIRVGTRGILLELPFTVDEFWATIDECHDIAVAALEDSD